MRRLRTMVPTGTWSDERELFDAMRALRARLEPHLCPDTAAPGIAGTAASAGHCAAVATIAFVRHGGDLVSCVVEDHSHWLNRFEIGATSLEVDLTGDQFGYPPVRIAHAPLFGTT
jgi:hypothetical protein